MRETRTPGDRFIDLVDHRLAPALEPLGFERRRAVLQRDSGEVRWLVELELAPWASPDNISFTLAWGVAVPGLDEVLGDDAMGPPSRVGQCPIHVRLGEGARGLEATWFTIGPVPAVPGLDRILDTRTAQRIVRRIDTELLPGLRKFDTLPAVQEHLVAALVRARGAAGESELRRIRWIAGLSLLLDERQNASRWLDYLEARSSASIAPDVVSERLAQLRQRCAS
jgi:hypothetical protein